MRSMQIRVLPHHSPKVQALRFPVQDLLQLPNELHSVQRDFALLPGLVHLLLRPDSLLLLLHHEQHRSGLSELHEGELQRWVILLAVLEKLRVLHELLSVPTMRDGLLFERVFGLSAVSRLEMHPMLQQHNL